MFHYWKRLRVKTNVTCSVSDFFFFLYFHLYCGTIYITQSLFGTWGYCILFLVWPIFLQNCLYSDQLSRTKTVLKIGLATILVRGVLFYILSCNFLPTNGCIKGKRVFKHLADADHEASQTPWPSVLFVNWFYSIHCLSKRIAIVLIRLGEYAGL